jgi:hypothetical protein
LTWVFALQLVGQGAVAQPQLPAAAAPESITTRADTASQPSAVSGQPPGFSNQSSAIGVHARKVNAGTAVLLSALLPGGGQYYTGNVLKGILIGGAELTLAGISVYDEKMAQKSTDSVQLAYYSDRRNTFLWWTGFSLAFSMADAYVSASMFGFKQEQRLDARFVPFGIEVAYRF